MFVHRADDLPETVAAVRVGVVLIVRDDANVETLRKICDGCDFRVVLSSEVPAA